MADGSISLYGPTPFDMVLSMKMVIAGAVSISPSTYRAGSMNGLGRTGTSV